MKTMGRPGNPHDRQHPHIRVNQPTNRRDGNILLVALSCAALLTSLTLPVALAQDGAEPQVRSGSKPTSGSAEPNDAASVTIPLSSATVLDALPEATRAEVERICLPVQYQSGAIAYRDCINEQIDAQPSASASGVPVTSLSFDEEYAIQQACRESGPMDSAAYRTCDEAQLVSLAGVPEPALEQVTEDDTYALQLGCYDSQTNDGVKAYRECLNESIQQLLALPQPDLSALTLVERNALQLRCSAQNTGAVAYRNCLLDAVSNTTGADRPINRPEDGVSAVETEAEPSFEGSAAPFIEPPEQLNSQPDPGAAGELAASSGDPQPAPETSNETAAETTPEVDANPIMTAQAIQLPTANDSNLRDSSELTDTLSQAPEDDVDSTPTPADLLTRVRTTMTGMDDMTRLLMWTAIGLPILLTLSWLLMRGRKSTAETEDFHTDSMLGGGVDTAPHRPSSTHRNRKPDTDTADFTLRNDASVQQDSLAPASDDDDALNFTAQIDELFGTSAPEPEPARSAKNDTRKDISRDIDATSDVTPLPADLKSNSPSAEFATSEISAFTDFTLTPATQRDDFLAWLSVQDEAKQQALAIEFLIYWMAYSDERYPPELKKRIFQLPDPGDHELIKRWTLKQDVHAFAGNLQWLQYNLSTQQHEQIIDLLLALLVSENALTPAQNTLLRFLADAFGLGAQRLDALYQAGFAQPMPPLPELDNPEWWNKQPADSLKRWDARSVSRQSSEIRYRVALGLPLREELNPESIVASFKRASKRCQPERFNRLSSREQNLAAKQLGKYVAAAESLLEVSA